MKGRYLILALLGTAALVLLLFYPFNSGLQKGQLAPDFSLTSFDGGEISLHQFKGQVVLLNFWASWCPPCVLEMPSLNQLHQRLQTSGFTVLAVSVDESWEPIRHFFAKSRVAFPVLLDDAGKIATRYGSDRLPESLLIDRSGKITDIYYGARDWTDPLTEGRITALVNP